MMQKAKSLAKEWHAVTNVNEEKAIQYVKMHGISPELRKITPGNKIGKVRCRFSEEGVVFVIDKSKSSQKKRTLIREQERLEKTTLATYVYMLAV